MTITKSLLRKAGLFEPTRSAWLWLSRPEWWKNEQQKYRFFRNLVPRGSLCFDVGANVGGYTADLLGLGARVVAVEPQAVCLESLTEKYANEPRVTVVPAAVGPETGTVTLYTSDASAIGSCSRQWVETMKSAGRFAGHDWTAPTDVPMTTLDALIAEHGVPAFLKIDVEGFELDVLHGLSRPIPVISFEYTPETIDQTRRCVAYIARLGRYEFNYCVHDRYRYDLPVWLDEEAFLEQLGRMPPDAMTWGGDVYARQIARGQTAAAQPPSPHA